MFKRFFKIIIVVLCTVNSLCSFGQDSDLKSIIDGCIKKYAFDYSSPQKKDVTVNDFFVGKYKSNTLKEVFMWIFTSKKIISKNTRRGFKIVAYQYATVNNASDKFKELETVKQTQDDGIFGKGWNHIILQGNKIILITSNCYYSKSEWAKLTIVFDQEVNKLTPKIMRIIDCNCGGNCS